MRGDRPARIARLVVALAGGMAGALPVAAGSAAAEPSAATPTLAVVARFGAHAELVHASMPARRPAGSAAPAGMTVAREPLALDGELLRAELLARLRGMAGAVSIVEPDLAGHEALAGWLERRGRQVSGAEIEPLPLDVPPDYLLLLAPQRTQSRFNPGGLALEGFGLASIVSRPERAQAVAYVSLRVELFEVRSGLLLDQATLSAAGPASPVPAALARLREALAEPARLAALQDATGELLGRNLAPLLSRLAGGARPGAIELIAPPRIVPHAAGLR
jgi:hypothetical protein